MNLYTDQELKNKAGLDTQVRSLARRVSVPLDRLVGRVAGHIRKPYTLRQIIRQIESNEYNAEMMLQHLLRWVAANNRITQQHNENRPTH